MNICSKTEQHSTAQFLPNYVQKRKNKRSKICEKNK